MVAHPDRALLILQYLKEMIAVSSLCGLLWALFQYENGEHMMIFIKRGKNKRKICDQAALRCFYII